MKQKLVSSINRFIYNDKKIATFVLSVLLIAVMFVTSFAWYRSQVSLNGSIFSTGKIDFIATGYNELGEHVTTILQDGKNEEDFDHVNEPLFKKTGWQAGDTDTAYIIIEKKNGSLAIDYKISFSAAGDIEYLGGFWYALTDITNNIPVDIPDEDKLQEYIKMGYDYQHESNGYSMATMDRYATKGSILNDGVNKRYYRLDYGMKESAITEDYTNKTVEIIPTIYVTQVGALDADDGLGYTYNCLTWEDIAKARDSSLPGDSIKLLKNITFEGDLVFNKSVNILTNNYTLEVLGNLIYDFVSPKSLTISAAGNGTVKVSSPGDGIGGNFTVNAPGSDVTFIGSNNSAGDIVVDSKFTVNATRSYGAAGVSFDRVRIIDKASSLPATIYVEDDTRVTVLDNTTITRLEAVARSRNIEIQNVGTIHTIALSGMNVLPQVLSPQILIVNMGYISQPIQLPTWSRKFTVLTSEPLTCEGNTRIIQTITGNNMTVTGADEYTEADIERESTVVLVAPIGNSDGELIVYYQNIEENGATVDTSIQYLLEKYFTEKGSEPSVSISKITRLDIVSIGDKSVTNSDIEYLKSDKLQSLKYLDLERANVHDTATDTPNRLCDNAFKDFKRISTLILPQNLEEIGYRSLYGIENENIITIPGSVTTFGTEWFYGNNYVAFSASSPVLGAYTASRGMQNVKAIFVEEYYIDSYKTAYIDFADMIFPMAEKDDSGIQFVRMLAGSNEWEIVYYIGNGTTDIAIGDNLRYGGNIITVTSVGNSAYQSALKNVSATLSFSDNIKYIGESAFAETGITKVEHWGTSITTIHSSAFDSCKQLAGDIILPSSLQTIQSSAFNGCTKITGVYTGGAVFVESSAFSDCTGLVWVEMPYVETLDQTNSTQYTGMFYNNTKLVSVKLPSLQKSNGIIFNRTQSLTEVVFGDTLYSDVAVSGYTSFYSNFGKPKIYFDMSDVSEVTINKVDSNMVYPSGKKMGEKLVNNYDVGEYIISDTLQADGVTLITSNLSYEGDVTLPDTWGALPINYIGANAFVNQTFTNVNLSFGNNLKVIGASAFSGIKGIASVTHWSDSLETIGRGAFEGCEGIKTKIVLPDSLRTIENDAFKKCRYITGINTGGAEVLGSGVFTNCTSLVYAELPEVYAIGDGEVDNNAFYSCSALVSVNMPRLYDVKLSGMFNYCYNIRELIMSSNEPDVTLGTTPFKNGSITNIKLYVPVELLETYKTIRPGNLAAERIYPQGEKMGEELINNVFNVGKYIVSDTLNANGTATLITTNINSFTGVVEIPGDWEGNPITSIYTGAFRNSNFTDATLKFSDNLEELGDYSFYERSGIIGVSNWGASLETIGKYAFYKTGITGELVLPSGNLNKVDNLAFYNCKSITSVNTGSATELGNQVFGGCSSIVTADLPEVVSVGDGASTNNLFINCTGLVSIKLPKLSSVQGTGLLASCTNLREIYMECDQPSLGSSPFNNTSSTLRKNIKIFVPEELVESYRSLKVGNIANQIYPQGEKVGENYINGYNIGDYIILDNDDGRTVTLVTATRSFEGTVVLDDTLNGKSVTRIGEYAFYNQSFKNVSLTVGSHVTEICKYAFSEITGIVSVDLKNTEAVRDYAFYNCTGLASLTANKLTYVTGTYSFSGCSSLTTLILPKLESADNHSFSRCTSLISVSVPELLTMQEYVFSNDTKLESIYFEQVQSFGGNDFYNCSSLTQFIINKVISSASDVPTGNPYFTNSKNCTIMVPIIYMDYYKDASGNWKSRPVASFDNVFNDEFGNSYIVTLDGTNCIVDHFLGSAATTSVVVPNVMAIDGTNYTVVGIEYGAFNSVSPTLTHITLPSGMYMFPGKCLSELTALTHISVAEGNRYYSADENGVLYNADGGMLIKYPAGKTDTAYTVNDSVYAIGEYAFNNCTNLTSLTFGSSVAVIDSSAFADCVLQSVTFTGETPPLLMGADIFDTTVEKFSITVPSEQIDRYIGAMNFTKYAPFIKR